MRNLISLGLLVAAFALFAACGSDSSTGPQDTGPTGPETMTIELGAETGAPLAAVTVEGLPDGADAADYWAVFTDPASGNQAYGPLTVTEDGWQITAPPHPTTPLAGGEVAVTVTDGAKAGSNEVGFVVGPMASGEGAFTALVDGLADLLTGWLVAHGTSRDELAASDPGQLDDVRAPLYLAFEAIDHPENPNSLRAMAEGTAPALTEFGIDTAQLDAVLAATGFGDLVLIQQAAVDSVDVVVPEGADEELVGDKLLTVSAGHLNELMWKAELAKIANSPNGQEILTRTGQAMAVIGMHPVMKPLAVPVGLGLWGYSKAIEAAENLYPSRFVYSEEDLRCTPTEFPEDEEDDGEWELWPVAASNGWTLDRAALEAIMQYVGLRGGGDLDSKVINEFLGSQFGQEVTGLLVGEGVNQVIGGVLGDPQAGVATIPPQTWTADVTDFCEPSVVDGDAIVTLTLGSYRINEVGTSRLRVSKQDGYFGYQALLRFKDITVNPIEVTISPAVLTAEPGAPITFVADVENANDTSVRWILSDGALDANGLQATAYMPDVRWEVPIILEVESTATGGLRADGEPRRWDYAVIECEDVEIIVAPAGICIEEGDTQPFTAEVDGYDEPYELAWTASVGSFSGNIYTAPGFPVDAVTITATIVGTDHTGETLISVGDCACHWEATLSGELSGTIDGDYAAYESFSAEGETGTTFYFRPDFVEGFPSFYATIVPALGSQETGSRYALTFHYPVGDPTGWLSLEDDELGTRLPVLDILSNDGETVQGTLSGDLVKIVLGDPPQIQIAGFSMEFTARQIPPGGGNPCE